MTRTLMLAAAAAVATVAVPAMADQRVVSTTIMLADLDLGVAADRAELNDRVGTAIRRMCRGYGKQTEAERLTSEGCMIEAQADADAKLRSLGAGVGEVEVTALMR